MNCSKSKDIIFFTITIFLSSIKGLHKSFKLIRLEQFRYDVSLEIIPSTLFTIGSGGVAGFLVGFALKRVMKILAVTFGLFFGGLIYLQSQSIININWDKLQSLSESTLSIIGNSIFNTGQISTITGNLGIPLTRGLSAGFTLGLIKG